MDTLLEIWEIICLCAARGKKRLRRFLTSSLVEPPRNYRGKKRMIRLGHANHLILFAVVFLYSEIILRLLNGTGVFQHLIYPILFGLAYGMFLNIPTTLFSRRINRRITIAALAVIGVMYCTECIIHNTFETYMTVHSMLSGAGGVATGYTGDAIKAIFGGIPAIILLMLPTVIYFLIGARLNPALQYRPVFSGVMFVCGLVLCLLTSFLASHGKVSDQYTDQYDFNQATATFGLPTGMRLSMTRSESTTAKFTTDETEASDESETAAEGETEAAAASYGVNTMDIDFDTLLANNTDENVTAITEYVKTLSGSNQNAYTGLFKGKNLILICAEAFSDAVISEELTPTLYRMQHNGIYFSDYYQPTWGGSTSTGEYSFLIGLSPNNGVDTMQEIIGHNMYFTMGNQMQRLGYFNAAFHNGKYTYYDRDKTHPYLGYGEWIANGNGLKDITGVNSPDDETMISTTLDYYVNQQPFSIYYMTVSGHAAYKKDSRYTEAYLDYVKEHITREYDDTTLYYLCYQVALEKAMETLVQKLEDYGIADDTVVCLTADHYPYGLRKSDTWGNKKNYVADLYGQESTDLPWEKDHNAWILWSGCLENENKNMACEISEPTFSLDILPTLSNLFGLEYDSRLLAGRDVFSDQEAIVYWNNGSFVTAEGKYYSPEKEWTPNEGSTAGDDYVERISGIVKNRQNLSTVIRQTDYYGLLFGEDTDTSDNKKENTGTTAASSSSSSSSSSEDNGSASSGGSGSSSSETTAASAGSSSGSSTSGNSSSGSSTSAGSSSGSSGASSTAAAGSETAGETTQAASETTQAAAVTTQASAETSPDEAGATDLGNGQDEGDPDGDEDLQEEAG